MNRAWLARMNAEATGRRERLLNADDAHRLMLRLHNRFLLVGGSAFSFLCTCMALSLAPSNVVDCLLYQVGAVFTASVARDAWRELRHA